MCQTEDISEKDGTKPVIWGYLRAGKDEDGDVAEVEAATTLRLRRAVGGEKAVGRTFLLARRLKPPHTSWIRGRTNGAATRRIMVSV